MPQNDILSTRSARSDWVRIRTLVGLRWMAVTGQAAAILVASGAYHVQLNLVVCLLIVGASAAFNLIATLVYPESKRLSEGEATMTFLFDSIQLAALLGMTGGMSNPFALLTLGPVTIAATTLQRRSTFVVGLLTIALITLVALLHAPLLLADGTRLASPVLIEFGVWLAIVIGVVFLGLYAQRVSSEIHSMGDALLATQMALAREQKLTDLGGVVAAAAHELGSPLATIKLASSELAKALKEQPDLRDDAELIRSQADRCRDILLAMGRIGKDDLYLWNAPLSAVLQEAAEPHATRGKTLIFQFAGSGDKAAERQPVIERRPEVVHGLRNLIQNAVDFAREKVWIDAEWRSGRITVTIADDGHGYPQDLIGRIGDPYVHRRPAADIAGLRPEYEGMGLGLFIAKTLLERTGATLRFSNATDPFLSTRNAPQRSGAVVEVSWPEESIIAKTAAISADNPPMQTGKSTS